MEIRKAKNGAQNTKYLIRERVRIQQHVTQEIKKNPKFHFT